jgi:hypothetical protein
MLAARPLGNTPLFGHVPPVEFYRKLAYIGVQYGGEEFGMAGHTSFDGSEYARQYGPAACTRLARRIEQISGDSLNVNYGTLYPALLRLEQEALSQPSGAPPRTVGGRLARCR